MSSMDVDPPADESRNPNALDNPEVRGETAGRIRRSISFDNAERRTINNDGLLRITFSLSR